jgi:hypothetical protein
LRASHVFHPGRCEVAGVIRVGDPSKKEDFTGGLLWSIITVLFVLWLIGFVMHFGGGLIHLLLVIAVVLFVVNLLTGRGARV